MRTGREIFEAIVLGKEWDFTDAEFESAVLDRQHTYPVLTQKGIDASGATVDVAVSNMLPINGSDFSGEIRNMLAALAQRIRETQPTMSQFASKLDYERAVAARPEELALEELAKQFDSRAKVIREAIAQQSSFYMQVEDQGRSSIQIAVWEQAAAEARSFSRRAMNSGERNG